MAKQEKLSRGQALDARPVVAEIQDRKPLDDGGQRLTVMFETSRWQRWMLRLPQFVTRDFELDSFGVEIVELCDGRRTVRDIIKKFASKHKVSRPEAEKAVLMFLRTLIRKGIVSIAISGTSDGK
ncbi:MAG: PqqD family protein [Planctomycetes bacterium]|nr:PqqD family protein [Planctomycetota bacterium]